MGEDKKYLAEQEKKFKEYLAEIDEMGAVVVKNILEIREENKRLKAELEKERKKNGRIPHLPLDAWE